MASIGPRLWKTGLAVALTIFVIRTCGLRYEVFGAVAAALAVAPSASHSLRTASNQILANILGGSVGALAALFLGSHPLVVGGVVILVLQLCQWLHWREVSSTVVTVTLFVMSPHAESAETYAMWRLLSVVVGAIVGTGVNALIVPPDYGPATARAIRSAGVALDSFILKVAGRLEQPHTYRKEDVVADAGRVEDLIREARRLLLLMGETGRAGARGSRRAVLERAIKVLSSWLERILLIHKASLTARWAPDYNERLPEVQRALAELVDHRLFLYDLLPDSGAPAALGAALRQIELQFDAVDAVPREPSEVEAFFWLYRIRASISYMAQRLDRLRNAMDASSPARQPAAEGAERLLRSRDDIGYIH